MIDRGPGWRRIHQPTHRNHFYDVQRYEFSGAVEIRTNGSCQVMSLVEGRQVLVETADGLRQRFNFAETFVVPAAAGSYRLSSEDGSPIKVVRSYVKPQELWTRGSWHERLRSGHRRRRHQHPRVLVDFTGKILGVGLSGASNYNDVGVERAQHAIDLAVAAAAGQAGAERRDCAAVFLGMAGVTSESDHAYIHQMATNLVLAPEDRIGVDHDCRAALAGGLEGRPGIVQIVGTGSSCYGRNAAGAGGRRAGAAISSPTRAAATGSASRPCAAAVMAYDGRLPGTLLYDSVLAALGIASVEEILHRLYVQGMARVDCCPGAAGGGRRAGLAIRRRLVCSTRARQTLRLACGP